MCADVRPSSVDRLFLLRLTFEDQRGNVAEASEQFLRGCTDWHARGILGGSGGELGIKIKSIVRPTTRRPKGGFHLTTIQFLPIDSLEEHVGVDLLDAVWSMTKSVRRVTFEENPEEGLGICTQELRHPQLSFQNECHCSLSVFSLEG